MLKACSQFENIKFAHSIFRISVCTKQMFLYDKASKFNIWEGKKSLGGNYSWKWSKSYHQKICSWQRICAFFRVCDCLHVFVYWSIFILRNLPQNLWSASIFEGIIIILYNRQGDYYRLLNLNRLFYQISIVYFDVISVSNYLFKRM